MIGLDVTRKPLSQIEGEIREAQQTHAETIAAFHRLFYHAPFTWGCTYWQGVPILKNPCDLLQVQQIVHDLKPALIVETGTAYGGSALFLSHLCDLNGRGEVVTIDLDPPEHPPTHSRLRYVRGSSTDAAVVDYVTALASRAWGPVLVLLDSDHHAPHVSAELDAYAPLVTLGSFVVVEDTNVNGHPVLPEWGPGPMEAVEAFLAQHPEFAVDILSEHFLVTMHPGGWLRRVA